MGHARWHNIVVGIQWVISEMWPGGGTCVSTNDRFLWPFSCISYLETLLGIPWDGWRPTPLDQDVNRLWWIKGFSTMAPAQHHLACHNHIVAILPTLRPCVVVAPVLICDWFSIDVQELDLCIITLLLSWLYYRGAPLHHHGLVLP